MPLAAADEMRFRIEIFNSAEELPSHGGRGMAPVRVCQRSDPRHGPDAASATPQATNCKSRNQADSFGRRSSPLESTRRPSSSGFRIRSTTDCRSMGGRRCSRGLAESWTRESEVRSVCGVAICLKVLHEALSISISHRLSDDLAGQTLRSGFWSFATCPRRGSQWRANRRPRAPLTDLSRRFPSAMRPLPRSSAALTRALPI
jgi:hypothetical protein